MPSLLCSKDVDTVKALQALGILTNAKRDALDDTALLKLLRKALNHAQSNTANNDKLDFRELDDWDHSKKLFDEFKQFTFMEGFIGRAEPATEYHDITAHVEALFSQMDMTLDATPKEVEEQKKKFRQAEQYFYDLRQSFWSIGKHLDDNPALSVCKFEDKNNQSSVLLKLLGVKKLGDRPIIPVLYVHNIQAEALMTAGDLPVFHFLNKLLKSALQQIVHIHARIPEQNILLALLELNEGKIDPEYRKSLDLRYPESEFKLSFIVPTGPLDPDTLAKLQPLQKCHKCGKVGKGTCGKCKVGSYCSTECQKSHWPVHKQQCKTGAVIKNKEDAPGEYVEFACSAPEDEGVMFIQNYRTPAKLEAKPTKGGRSKAPDVHGGRRFMVKVQGNSTMMPIMIYDQKRSFSSLLQPASPGFKEIHAIISKNTRWHNLKAFIWVRRIDPDALKFVAALKDLPDQNQVW